MANNRFDKSYAAYSGYNGELAIPEDNRMDNVNFINTDLPRTAAGWSCLGI